MTSENERKGYAALVATIAIWATPSLFQFFLNRYYDPFAQNFYRYSIAFLAILPLVVYRMRRDGQRLDRRVLGMCFLPSLPNVVHQITQVVSLFYMGPGVYSVFIRSSVIITALLALIFFPEERWIVRQWQFQIGTFLGLLGAVGVFWFQPRWEGRHVSLAGFAIVFIASFCWALYGVLAKKPSAQLGSVRSFGIISLFTSLMLLPLTCFFGRLSTPWEVSTQVNGILVISAVFCITIAHVLYYIAIREIGVALSQTLQLLSPLGAILLSTWLFHERLTTIQLASAAILLFGAFLATRVKPQPALVTAAENL
jgi:drug/metabolite transporter (DMT)-like permease